MVGHITPEAYLGGTIALVNDDDIIEIDAVNNTMNVLVDDAELERRRAAWQQPALKATNGILFKYARSVKDASEGCVTDEA